MELITIVEVVAVFGMGVATGLYISSQIENHIEKNIGDNHEKNGKK
tara:strand:+ start:173 stop:310 length:138 start_codon:yes stop_codon:yes gene_type:complete